MTTDVCYLHSFVIIMTFKHKMWHTICCLRQDIGAILENNARINVCRHGWPSTVLRMHFYFVSWISVLILNRFFYYNLYKTGMLITSKLCRNNLVIFVTKGAYECRVNMWNNGHARKYKFLWTLKNNEFVQNCWNEIGSF